MFYRFAAYGFLKNLKFFEPFLVLFFRSEGLLYLQIGVLYSIRDLATSILEIPTGVIADAFGRRISMVLAFVAYIISFLIFTAFSNFYIFAVAMFLFALGEAFRTGTHKALILEHLKLNDMSHLKVQYYGRTRAASQLGSALNSLIGAALVFYTGDYRYIFVASIVPYGIDLVNLWTYPKQLDGELVELQRGTLGSRMAATLKEFFAIFRNANAMRAILNSSGFDAFFSATKDYLQPVLEAFAISLPILLLVDDTKRAAVVIGLVYFVIYLIATYASRASSQVGERFRSTAQAINVTFVIGAGLLLVAGLTSWSGVALLSILVFLALFVLFNLRRPMNVAYVSDQISHQVMASGLSVESQVKTVLMVVLSPILGALADWLSVGAALACMGGMMMIVWLFVRLRSEATSEAVASQA
jgi:MFS family permease